MFVNVQHPSADNPFPHNHSYTMAISGFDSISSTFGVSEIEQNMDNFFTLNPISRELILNEVSDLSIYDVTGRRLMVSRQKKFVDVSSLKTGNYFIRLENGQKARLVIQ